MSSAKQVSSYMRPTAASTARAATRVEPKQGSLMKVKKTLRSSRRSTASAPTTSPKSAAPPALSASQVRTCSLPRPSEESMKLAAAVKARGKYHKATNGWRPDFSKLFPVFENMLDSPDMSPFPAPPGKYSVLRSEYHAMMARSGLNSADITAVSSPFVSLVEPEDCQQESEPALEVTEDELSAEGFSEVAGCGSSTLNRGFTTPTVERATWVQGPARGGHQSFGRYDRRLEASSGVDRLEECKTYKEIVFFTHIPGLLRLSSRVRVHRDEHARPSSAIVHSQFHQQPKTIKSVQSESALILLTFMVRKDRLCLMKMSDNRITSQRLGGRNLVTPTFQRCDDQHHDFPQHSVESVYDETGKRKGTNVERDT
ncbi:hypothetical protein M8818_003324 [Zalaria obscura]|uniref:Uncharacterized protein n=1 Tax=Zalaria obscura TaxID=2024903 RepID=A0ACC3SF95_9PEZI